jgi:hypothetical protein
MKTAWIALAAMAVAGSAGAAAVAPSSYSMANGSGVANGGQFNYWDANYSGSGATTTDGAALSGGLGDLTDGVIAADNWFDVENTAGSGPYVGWRSALTPNPVVTFFFGAPVDIDLIRVHADDSGGAGGVNLPSSVLITWAGGSLSVAVVDPDPASTAPAWLDFGGLGIGQVSSLSLQFFNSNEWVFIDEVSFANGGNAVPLPATLGLVLLGLAAARQRRGARTR